MNQLEPSELEPNSIIVIEPRKGNPFYFFINKCADSIVPNEQGVVWIYGRPTEDLIKHCAVIDIAVEVELVIYKVPPLNAKISNSFVENFRRLSSQEKVHLLAKIDGFENSSSEKTQKVHEYFCKALSRRKFRNLDNKKGQSVASSL